MAIHAIHLRLVLLSLDQLIFPLPDRQRQHLEHKFHVLPADAGIGDGDTVSKAGSAFGRAFWFPFRTKHYRFHLFSSQFSRLKNKF